MTRILLIIALAIAATLAVIPAASFASAGEVKRTAVSPSPSTRETVNQENAREKAQSYLDYKAFSRTGLIDQLKYEGFSKKDATYAVNAIRPNWNQQAVKAAKAYLDYSSFSRQGLIDQLVYEGFTMKQAIYGVRKTGLK
jgi:SOS response regulatory protein OraA/RecX